MMRVPCFFAYCAAMRHASRDGLAESAVPEMMRIFVSAMYCSSTSSGAIVRSATSSRYMRMLDSVGLLISVNVSPMRSPFFARTI